MHITGATTIVEATTAKQVGCVVNVYETGNPVSAQGPSSCTIEVHLRYRYQLKIRSNEGTLILIEDLMTPEMCTSQRVPVVFPLSKWRELYLSDILKCWNLEARVGNFLLPKIVDAAVSIAERKGDKGFGMVAKVGILKVEILSKDETARIAAEL